MTVKVTEDTKYYAWFNVTLKPGVEQQLLDIYRLASENPGHDLYSIVVIGGETGQYGALLTPEYNTFHYTQKIHLEFERLLGSGKVTARAIESRTSFQFDSPIEQAFWNEWLSCTNNSPYQLVPQYPIGRYRVDFAHIDTKTAIELDGFASHSSTEDIANDRKRQRYIESQGWRVARFGGKEVHSDVTSCVMEVYQIVYARDHKHRESGR